MPLPSPMQRAPRGVHVSLACICLSLASNSILFLGIHQPLGIQTFYETVLHPFLLDLNGLLSQIGYRSNHCKLPTRGRRWRFASQAYRGLVTAHNTTLPVSMCGCLFRRIVGWFVLAFVCQDIHYVCCDEEMAGLLTCSKNAS